MKYFTKLAEDEGFIEKHPLITAGLLAGLGLGGYMMYKNHKVNKELLNELSNTSDSFGTFADTLVHDVKVWDDISKASKKSVKAGKEAVKAGKKSVKASKDKLKEREQLVKILETMK